MQKKTNADEKTEQTTRRFRMCEDCNAIYCSVRSVRQHQHKEGHEGVTHITATVQE